MKTNAQSHKQEITLRSYGQMRSADMAVTARLLEQSDRKRSLAAQNIDDANCLLEEMFEGEM